MATFDAGRGLSPLPDTLDDYRRKRRFTVVSPARGRPVRRPPAMERRLARHPRRDVVGYSRLMEADEVATLATLKAR